MALDLAQLAVHRSYLVRYAMLQLRDETQAEDVVQETLLAALQANFSGQSSIKTWLTGILKHKIIDLIRKKSREPGLPDDFSDVVDTGDFDPLFSDSHHWDKESMPHSWDQTAQSIEDRQFWAVYEACSQQMPKRVALVFSLREVMGLEIDEICKRLEITSTNCSVILYRARMSLRLCLEKNWFGIAGRDAS
ncbi:RNA polymerase sigma-70 factor (ECF subfamily) [Chitinivorax tropicus]|uniref:RNA polymerase sigma-70 factor (ECF subfamily) n=1 Tax=Chitinivorax tropicus TaxID=714531 RepID=A0A840MP78_9PROT|nr:sigma-70 family RNA polymerase sigma factor [Chitinivorax tropicus]MBB5017983.1 RNA polymerase sigma-70 factor (ECF subfamily) [Chitinivorax tropicus]